ncbi:putative galacturonosyltransferase 7 [Silene latifolia]|uniref:putative galacturonosyltransferase 7 n=1 Tax=Silene latifolia TaxID=37657 RepID=UPI003D778326
MKSGVSPKRRCNCFFIAVLGLAILSMLVPLVFLLGFHSSGFPFEQETSLGNALEGYGLRNFSHIIRIIHQEHVNNPIEEMPVRSGINNSSNKSPMQVEQGNFGPPAGNYVHVPSPTRNEVKISSPVQVIQPAKNVDENEMHCELRFGSYCLWRREHKEVLIDSMLKKMKDLLFVARAYFPSIAKLRPHEKLSTELKQNIQDFERIIGEATTDSDLPSHLGEKLQRMEAVIARSKSIRVDCNNVDKKFRQLLEPIEDEANFHTKQSAFLYQLAVQTMPKSLHCLSMRLTVEYFNKGSMDLEVSPTESIVDPELYHYVVLSRNILASSVLINSTVAHAKESKKLVFHILTDRENYYSMKMWFLKNSFSESAIQVLNLEDYIPESYIKTPDLSLAEEFRVSFQPTHKLPPMHYKTEYISLFSHSHYLLPKIFKNFDKIVVLDDDMLVQKDLSGLWKIDMGKNVNGAVEMCAVRLGQLSSYLGRNSLNSSSCVWMSGLNVIDLAKWRELNLSETFRKFVKQLDIEGTHYEAAASRASLLTFQDLVYPLDDSWVLSGLGHNYGLGSQAIRNAAVLHYNGNMKPWLELGIPKYKSFWVKFMNRGDQFLSECNVSL